MPAIIVRDAAADDAAAIARVHAASWQAAYRGIVDDDRLDRMLVDERERRWRERLTGPLNGFTIVGERECSLLGFCAVAVEAECEIGSLYVDPSAYRKGIGTALLNEALGRLRVDGHREVMLWVFADNHGARAFYAGFGFEPVAELTGSMGIPIVQLKAGLAA